MYDKANDRTVYTAGLRIEVEDRFLSGDRMTPDSYDDCDVKNVTIVEPQEWEEYREEYGLSDSTSPEDVAQQLAEED